jgi:hypothetical protein
MQIRFAHDAAALQRKFLTGQTAQNRAWRSEWKDETGLDEGIDGTVAWGWTYLDQLTNRLTDYVRKG